MINQNSAYRPSNMSPVCVTKLYVHRHTALTCRPSASPGNTEPVAKAEPAKAEKPKSAKTKSKSKPKSAEPVAENNGPVKLFVRLYFSGHEKLSEQRWIDRIPTEEP